MQNNYIPRAFAKGQYQVTTGKKGRTKTTPVTLKLLNDEQILNYLADGHLIGLFQGRTPDLTDRMNKEVEARRKRKGNNVVRKSKKKNYPKLKVSIPSHSAFKANSAPKEDPAIALLKKHDKTMGYTLAKELVTVDIEKFKLFTKSKMREIAKAVGMKNVNDLTEKDAEEIFAKI